MIIEQIDKSELRALVELSYIDDKEGFKQYHIEPFDYRQSVECTMDLIEAQPFEMIYYSISTDKLIGYMVVYDKVLFSFCIEIKSRTKEILLAWWQAVIILLGATFVVPLYDNNKRAINFLLKRGMKIFEQKDNLIILINTALCQQQEESFQE